MTAVAVIQARMGSTRLPGKSLADLGGWPLLDWSVERARMARGVDEVVVATSTLAPDDQIAEYVARHQIACIRGSADDVLARYALAVSERAADVIVRITADCPFVDPAIVEQTITALAAADYASTSLDGRYPRGFDVEAVRRDVLEIAAAESVDPAEREHVTLFVYRRPDRFDCRPVEAPEWARRPDLRFTVDEGADLELARAVVAGTSGTPRTLTGIEVIRFLDEHPDIAALNRAVAHRNIT
jgi:spore coat polysaccharide biosynthesis protein SpsF